MKDYLGFAGKTCVVTGAASGMGRATAQMLVDLGASVYALDWAEAAVDGIAGYVHVNLGDKDSIDEAFAALPGRIDSYFGIAGVSGATTDFLTTVKIDFVSNKYICETYLTERMGQGGTIAFMTSTGGNGWERDDNKSVYLPAIEAEGWDATCDAIAATGFVYLPGTLGYPFAKLAMNYYTVYAAGKFGPKGIRVNAVLPGSTDTGLKGEFEKMGGGEAGLIANNGYAGRFAASEEMAAPIVFLNSDMASFISGERLVVDYARTAEEVAGIRAVEVPISLAAIREAMMRRAQG